MDKFKQIFSGLTIAYGQYQPGDRGENGSKQKGKAFKRQIIRMLSTYWICKIWSWQPKRI